MERKVRIAILVHGGAGPKQANRIQLRKLSEAIEAGYSILADGGSSLDAVEEAIRRLEDSGLFNAGRGSRLQLDGRCRMDASIMEGRDLKAGAVAGIEGVKNPIRLARRVMQETPHVLLVGDGAGRLARHFKLEATSSPTKKSLQVLKKTLKGSEAAVRLYSQLNHETVGAVALDRNGHLAAGASTGGISAMLPGRVGDSPLIGSGVYADNEAGAVTLTGWGESIIRAGLAKEICDRLASGLSPQRAAEWSLKRLRVRINGEAGAIVLNQSGELVLLHTTPFLCAGYRREGQRAIVKAGFQRVK
jgi:beta-aspartyl-peptidase (threonine type)